MLAVLAALGVDSLFFEAVVDCRGGVVAVEGLDIFPAKEIVRPAARSAPDIELPCVSRLLFECEATISLCAGTSVDEGSVEDELYCVDDEFSYKRPLEAE